MLLKRKNSLGMKRMAILTVIGCCRITMSEILGQLNNFFELKMRNTY